MEIIKYQFKICDQCKKVVYTDEKYCNCNKVLKIGYKLLDIENYINKKKGIK